MSHQDACGLDVETSVQIPLAEGPAALSELEFHTDIVLHDLLYLTDRVVLEEPGTALLGGEQRWRIDARVRHPLLTCQEVRQNELMDLRRYRNLPGHPTVILPLDMDDVELHCVVSTPPTFVRRISLFLATVLDKAK